MEGIRALKASSTASERLPGPHYLYLHISRLPMQRFIEPERFLFIRYPHDRDAIDQP